MIEYDQMLFNCNHKDNFLACLSMELVLLKKIDGGVA